MSGPHWRERLVEELHRQGLPSAYVDRLVEELAEHTHDLLREDQGMDAESNLESRLGDPEQLASVAKVEFQRRTFAGRHPALTFVAGPVFAVVGTFVGTCLLLWGTAFLIDLVLGLSLGGDAKDDLLPSIMEIAIMQTFNLLIRTVPFVLSTWQFIRLGRRSGRGAWGLVACGIITLAAVVFSSKLYPETSTSQALWIVGLARNIGLDQIVQAALPLVVGAWMLRESLKLRLKQVDFVALDT